MPFQSKAQQGYMFVHHPEIAKRWAAETPNIKSLPEHKPEMDMKKAVKMRVMQRLAGK